MSLQTFFGFAVLRYIDMVEGKHKAPKNVVFTVVRKYL